VPGADPATGLSFFGHVDEAGATSPDGKTIDVPLDVLERRESCALTACEAGCAPGAANCLVSDCDAARECAALSSFRQNEPVAIAAHGSIVSRSELFVSGDAAGPARLADLVVDLDFFAADEIAIRAIHGDSVTTLLGPGTQEPPRFGAVGRGEYVVPLDSRDAASPSGLWVLEVVQLRQFFTGAVLSWGIDLYR